MKSRSGVSDLPRRITCNNRVWGNVVSDDRAGCDYGSASDRNALKYCCIETYPSVIFDHNRFRRYVAENFRMAGCINLSYVLMPARRRKRVCVVVVNVHAVGNKNSVPYVNRRCRPDSRMLANKTIITDMYLSAMRKCEQLPEDHAMLPNLNRVGSTAKVVDLACRMERRAGGRDAPLPKLLVVPSSCALTLKSSHIAKCA